MRVPRLARSPAALPRCRRLAPPAYLMGRCASEDTQLAGYFLPKGEQEVERQYCVRVRPVAK